LNKSRTTHHLVVKKAKKHCEEQAQQTDERQRAVCVYKIKPNARSRIYISLAKTKADYHCWRGLRYGGENLLEEFVKYSLEGEI
jgi:hypothetical protein